MSGVVVFFAGIGVGFAIAVVVGVHIVVLRRRAHPELELPPATAREIRRASRANRLYVRFGAQRRLLSSEWDRP